MIWTWKDVKLAALQKMFAADGNTIPNDESVTDYIASMPQACNEALSALARAGKYIIKSLSIAHNPIPNMLNSNVDEQLLTQSYSASCVNGRSYYFEYTGTGTLTINSDGTITTVDLDSKDYKAVRGFLTGENIQFTFTPIYPLTVTNLAFYAVPFATVEDIPAYMPNIKYDLKALANDFYRVDSIYYNGKEPRYIQTSEYTIEGEKNLALKRSMIGNYIVYYQAFPDMITADTTDDYVFDLPDDFMLLVPMYMASQLYKEDDLSIATSYRNEFEVEVARLSEEALQSPTAEYFTSESGWI